MEGKLEGTKETNKVWQRPTHNWDWTSLSNMLGVFTFYFPLSIIPPGAFTISYLAGNMWMALGKFLLWTRVSAGNSNRGFFVVISSLCRRIQEVGLNIFHHHFTQNCSKNSQYFSENLPLKIQRQFFNEKKCVRIEAVWRLPPFVRHWEPVESESMYILRMFDDKRHVSDTANLL